MNPFLSIFFGTFVLEDVALASGLLLFSEQKMSFMSAFLACFLGIATGDLGLYGLGYLAAKFGLQQRWLRFFKKYFEQVKSGFWSEKTGSSALSSAIVVSRLIPGTRLPTYLAAGFLRFSFWRFLWLTLMSVFLWVSLAFLAGRSIQYFFKELLAEHWLPAILLILILFGSIKSLMFHLSDRWRRKAFIHSWRKYLSFEFWPAVIFYLPIVPLYTYLSLKYRSIFNPFYVNPHLYNGGMLGESKWDFLRHLEINSSSSLNSLKLSAPLKLPQVLDILQSKGFQYPFILKPDVGQRGFAVRIIHNEQELEEYLKLSQFDCILQRLSVLPNEAGIFYVRRPAEMQGFIFSLTDKKFPVVIGDGITALGDLILRDKRARIIAPVYFARWQKQLDWIPALRESVQLSECGNHCQGAIFLNGKELISQELKLEIDRLAQQIPDFYFGRFDVRYENKESLMQGKFEIVEVNGPGSEATHIWDERTTLLEAYQVLIQQWGLLFEIGDVVKRSSLNRPRLQAASFFKEAWKVFFRKEKLSISS